MILKRSKWRIWRWFEPLDVQDLKVIIQDRTNWRDEYSVVSSIHSSHILGPSYDEEFSQIDWTQSIPEILIPRLGQALFKCGWDMGSYLRQSIDYIAYALGKIGHPSAIPTLIDFLEQQVDWHFDSSAKQKVNEIIFRALAEIGTLEALEAISNRQNA